MKRYLNLKIRTKIISTFILITFLIVAVGVIGTNNISKVNSNVDSIYNERLIPIQNITEVRKNVLLVRLNLSQLLMRGNTQSINYAVQQVKDLREINNSLMTTYSNSNITAEEKELINVFQENLKEYRVFQDKYIDLIRSNKLSEASGEYIKVSEAANKTESALNNLIELNKKIAQDMNNESDKIYHESLSFMIYTVLIMLIISIILGLILTRSIISPLKKIVNYSKAFGQGDLTKLLDIETKDEIGILADSLNQAVTNTKDLIKIIIKDSLDLNASSQQISATTEEVLAQALNIDEATKEISKGNEETSASLEEINASSQEIFNSSILLSESAQEGNLESKEIQNRAESMKADSIKSQNTTKELYIEKQEKILEAIKQGEVVKQIEQLASGISDIAGEINLLSLNAAIEAARAGEYGKGFAVVAEEVRKLAEESSLIVTNIQGIVKQVYSAFNNLSSTSKDVLEFMNNKVNKDYDAMIETGIQYSNDAEYLNSLVNNFYNSTQSINTTINEINIAIDSVSSTSEQSAASSHEISSSISQIVSVLEEVAHSTQSQAKLTEELNALVQKFKI